MNKAMLSMFGLLIGGLVVTLVVVLDTTPTPQERAAHVAAKPTKVK
ncbi:hypothetical protein [Burkholderia sp. D-99]|nr:hypothetical protein [Burkholderia sp. D-99]NHV27509.1 hypothetical protein [Burkholderia sp. D-99]